MGLRGVNSLLATLLLAGWSAGCLFRPEHRIAQLPPGEWREPLGGAARAPYAAESAPETPREVWRRRFERGVVSPPVVHEDLLLLGTTGRALLAANTEHGRRYWTRRFHGPVSGTVLREGDRVFLGTASRDGSVYAYRIDRGRKLWQRKLRSPVVGAPVLADGRLLVGTVRGVLSALDPANGQVLWRVQLPGAIVGPPLPWDGSVLVATVADTLLRLATADGALLARLPLPGTPSAPMARAGDRLLLPLHPRSIASYTLPALALLRTDTVSGLVLAAPAVAADGSAYVLTRTADVWRIGERGATQLATLGGAARESLTLARDGLLVGRLDGTLFLLARDGTERWRHEFGSALRAPVALVDGAAFVALLNGEVVKLQ